MIITFFQFFVAIIKCSSQFPLGANIIPNEYLIPVDKIQRVNGSQEDLACRINSDNDNLFVCDSPAESILNDGAIPRIDPFNDDGWARSILTLRAASAVGVIFDLRNLGGGIQVGSVEVVMFNCPQWGIHAQTVTLHDRLERDTVRIGLAQAMPPISCDSLVTVCFLDIEDTNQRYLSLELVPAAGARWIHVAEVTFYSRNVTGPRELCPNTDSASTTVTGKADITNYATPVA